MDHPSIHTSRRRANNPPDLTTHPPRSSPSTPFLHAPRAAAPRGDETNPIIIPDSDEEDVRPRKALHRKAKGDPRALRQKHMAQRERWAKQVDKGKQGTARDDSSDTSSLASVSRIFDTVDERAGGQLASTLRKPKDMFIPPPRSALPSGKSSVTKPTGLNDAGLQRTLSIMSAQPRTHKKSKPASQSTAKAPSFNDYRRPTSSANGPNTPHRPISNLPTVASPIKESPKQYSQSTDPIILVSYEEENAQNQQAGPSNTRQSLGGQAVRYTSTDTTRASPARPGNVAQPSQPSPRPGPSSRPSLSQTSRAASVSSMSDASTSVDNATKVKKRAGAFGSHAKKNRDANAVKGRALTPSAAMPMTRGGSVGKSHSFASITLSPLKSTFSLGSLSPRPEIPSISPYKPPIDTSSRNYVTPSPRADPSPRREAVNNLHPPTSAIPRRAGSLASRKVVHDDESFRDTVRRAPAGPIPGPRPYRPKRARPSSGAYVIPPIDAETWPTTQAFPSQYGRKTPTLGGKRRRMEASSPKSPGSGRDTSADTSRATPKSEPQDAVEDGSSTESRASGDQPLSPWSRLISLTPLGTLSSAEDAASIADLAEDIRLGESAIEDAPEEPPEEDLLAQFADFEFEAPSQETERSRSPGGSDGDGDVTRVAAEDPPHSPDSSPPTTAASPSKPSRDLTLVDSPVITPAKRKSSRSVSADSSPKLSAMDKTVDIATIMAEQEAIRAQARKQAEEKQAERARQVQEAIEKPGVEEHGDEDEGLGGLDAIFADADSSPELDEPLEDRRGGRLPRSARPRDIARSMNDVRVKTENGHRYRPEPNPLDEILRATQRDRKTGLTGEYFDNLAKTLEKMEAEEGCDPATYSVAVVDTHSAHVSISAKEMKGLARKLPVGLADDGLIAELVGQEEVQDELRSGFWECEAVAPESVDSESVIQTPRLDAVGLQGRLLQAAVDRNDLASIAMQLTLPGVLPTLRKADNAFALAEWAMCKVSLGRDDVRACASILCALFALDCPGPFPSSADIRESVMSILQAQGMSRTITLAVWTDDPLPTVNITRDEACEFVCSIIEASVLNAQLGSGDALVLAQLMVLLHADHSTLPDLRGSIDRILPDLWRAADVSPIVSSRELLQRVTESNIPLNGQARMLLGIGCRTKTQQDIMRWFAVSLLVPDRLDTMGDHGAVPDIESVERGMEVIYEELCQKDPDHVKIAHWLILFSESFSDINALIESLGEDAVRELEYLIEMIGRAMNKIQVRAFSKQKEHVNKSRLSQLHVNTKQMLDSAIKRRKRKMMEAMKGLREGHEGQMKLEFGRDQGGV